MTRPYTKPSLVPLAQLERAGTRWRTDPTYVWIGGESSKLHTNAFDSAPWQPPPAFTGSPDKYEPSKRTMGYYHEIMADPAKRDRLGELSGKTMVCHCSHSMCHGTAIQLAFSVHLLNARPPVLNDSRKDKA